MMLVSVKYLQSGKANNCSPEQCRDIDMILSSVMLLDYRKNDCNLLECCAINMILLSVIFLTAGGTMIEVQYNAEILI